MRQKPLPNWFSQWDGIGRSRRGRLQDKLTEWLQTTRTEQTSQDTAAPTATAACSSDTPLIASAEPIPAAQEPAGPQLAHLAAINLVDTAAQDSFAASSGTLATTNPGAAALTYGLADATNLSDSGGKNFQLRVSDGISSTSQALLVTFSGSTESPEQYVLADDSAPMLSAAAEALWEQALSNASRTLAELLNRADRDQLLQEVFGKAGTDAATFAANLQALLNSLSSTGLRIEVDLRSDAELNGALAAYAAVGHTGSERIYVNGDKLNNGQLDLTLTTSALLEEFGHAIDRRLNGGVDSPGDEGELFANLVTGATLTADQRSLIDAQVDSAVLTIEGAQVAVEQAVTKPSSAYTEQGTATDLFNTNNANNDFGVNVLNVSLAFTISNVKAGDQLNFGAGATFTGFTLGAVSLTTAVAPGTATGVSGLTYSVTYNSGTEQAVITFSGSGLNALSRANRGAIFNAATFSSTSDAPARTNNPTITVTDSSGNIAGAANQSNTVAITGVNDAPSITSGATASFAENGTGTVYTANATDPDASTTLTYSIAGTDAALFNINSSTGG
ncbi:hypothetical protein KBY76_10735, partial [Synechococcus sp. GreenBA-s]|nr:hypothetical protein [Synechococcus sp. GreenBA-s]